MSTTREPTTSQHAAAAGPAGPSGPSGPVRMMQAIVQDAYGTADVLELRRIPIPEIGDDEVLVRVRAAGVDPGVWHLMTGMPYVLRIAGFGLRKPRNPVRGRDLAGVVEAVGARVTRFRPGDEVMGIGEGSFAAYARARERKLVHKPANLTFEEAAVVPISASTALQALRKGAVKPGQQVLIIGASGGVGVFAVRIAKALGATVTGVSSTAKLELVRSLGADHVLDYTSEDIADGARRYDVVLDIGGSRSLTHLRRALTPRGTLVIVGGEEGGPLIGNTDRSVRALLVSPFVRHSLRPIIAKEHHEDLRDLNELIEAGTLTPVVDRTFPLAETADAVRYLEAGRARGKVAIAIQRTTA